MRWRWLRKLLPGYATRQAQQAAREAERAARQAEARLREAHADWPAVYRARRDLASWLNGAIRGGGR